VGTIPTLLSICSELSRTVGLWSDSFRGEVHERNECVDERSDRSSPDDAPNNFHFASVDSIANAPPSKLFRLHLSVPLKCRTSL